MSGWWYHTAMTVQITKADGTSESFKTEKLRRSLRRSGAGRREIQYVIDKITDELQDGMTTQEIYHRAFSYLHNHELPAAARYSLRRALFRLGPTGFPFETFLARLFEAEGYTTRTNMILQGRCATHEVDVGAHKNDHSFIAEAKFHSRPGIKSDLQVALYSYARLLDLKDMQFSETNELGIKEFCLVTNTKFTSSAISYGECVGLTMLSWNYPRRNNLHDRIQRAGIYPVTVLQSLSQKQSQVLIDHGAVLCRDLVNQSSVLRHLHVSEKHERSIRDEARALCRMN